MRWWLNARGIYFLQFIKIGKQCIKLLGEQRKLVFAKS
jgi:hypothetical protein